MHYNGSVCLDSQKMGPAAAWPRGVVIAAATHACSELAATPAPTKLVPELLFSPISLFVFRSAKFY